MKRRPRTWTVFLSYSSEDKEFADWLHGKLLSAELSVWYDRHQILVGDSIVSRIQEGLNGSELSIIVFSKRAVRSGWVKRELEPLIIEEIQSARICVLPVILDNYDQRKLPHLMSGKKCLHFTRKGDEQRFRELLSDIYKHLMRRGLLQESKRGSIPILKNRLPNPFGLRGGVEPDRFVQPGNVISEICEDISKGQSVSLVGARMIGKTSILKFLASDNGLRKCAQSTDKPGPLLWSLTDLQGFMSNECKGLLPAAVCAISQSRRVKSHFACNSHEQAVQWIKTTVKQGTPRDGRPVVVFMFDEFDRIVEMKGVNSTYFDELRSLAQNYRLSFVIASRTKIIDLPLPGKITTSPFFNFFKEYFLSAWDDRTSRRLFFEPRGNRLGLLTEEDFAFASRLTGCHPFLLQICAYHLFDARCSSPGEVDHERIKKNYMRESCSVYQYYWSTELTSRERAWLGKCLRATANGKKVVPSHLVNDTRNQKSAVIISALCDRGFLIRDATSFQMSGGIASFMQTL